MKGDRFRKLFAKVRWPCQLVVRQRNKYWVRLNEIDKLAGIVQKGFRTFRPLAFFSKKLNFERIKFLLKFPCVSTFFIRNRRSIYLINNLIPS